MELHYYQTPERRLPFDEWLTALGDQQARARDVEPVGEGVMELRIDWGPGYRVYFARLGRVVVLLLCGGDKRTQDNDIKRAKDYFRDYKARTAH
ncbi:MAG TPA: type II toxin-antitoxin system RelE/ParE family toxin [Burkholderiales bacterium]|nr:type II toxin-antitoxin system RelE/ParE family toxin [Burkholderiales bacterium]